MFWDYPRAGWQYDVMVAVIVAFVFLTPREWFRDQPRASSVTMIPSAEPGKTVFWIEPDQLADVPEAQRAERAGNLLRARTGKHYRVQRVEPIVDAEQDVKGFMVFALP